MKAVAEKTKPFGIKTVVKLNPIMVDGTGMCGGCRVTFGNSTKFAYVDGPELDAHDVDFDGLMSQIYMLTTKNIQAAKKVKKKQSPRRCAGCVLQRSGNAVAIGRLERFVADYEQNSGKIELHLW